MKRLKTLFILFGIIVFAGTPFMVQADQISPNPNSGTITVNGVPIEDIDLTALRNLIAYVPQDPLLFTGTVKENVLFAVDGASEEEYRTAVKAAQLEEEIAEFPERELEDRFLLLSSA